MRGIEMTWNMQGLPSREQEHHPWDFNPLQWVLSCQCHAMDKPVGGVRSGCDMHGSKQTLLILESVTWTNKMFSLKESLQGGLWSSENIMSVGKDETGRWEERPGSLRTSTIGGCRQTHNAFYDDCHDSGRYLASAWLDTENTWMIGFCKSALAHENCVGKINCKYTPSWC